MGEQEQESVTAPVEEQQPEEKPAENPSEYDLMLVPDTRKLKPGEVKKLEVKLREARQLQELKKLPESLLAPRQAIGAGQQQKQLTEGDGKALVPVTSQELEAAKAGWVQVLVDRGIITGMELQAFVNAMSQRGLISEGIQAAGWGVRFTRTLSKVCPGFAELLAECSDLSRERIGSIAWQMAEVGNIRESWLPNGQKQGRSVERSEKIVDTLLAGNDERYRRKAGTGVSKNPIHVGVQIAFTSDAMSPGQEKRNITITIPPADEEEKS